MKKIAILFSILTLISSCNKNKVKIDENNKTQIVSPATNYHNEFNNLKLIAKLDSAN
jgi:hypothetical protein